MKPIGYLQVALGVFVHGGNQCYIPPDRDDAVPESVLSESLDGDTIKIDISVGERHKNGVGLYFKVTNRRSGQNTAEAKMAMLFFDYKARKPVLVPPEFKILIEKAVS